MYFGFRDGHQVIHATCDLKDAGCDDHSRDDEHHVNRRSGGSKTKNKDEEGKAETAGDTEEDAAQSSAKRQCGQDN